MAILKNVLLRLEDSWTPGHLAPGRAQGPSGSPSGGWSSRPQPQFGLIPKRGVDLDKSAQSPHVQHGHVYAHAPFPHTGSKVDLHGADCPSHTAVWKLRH